MNDTSRTRCLCYEDVRMTECFGTVLSCTPADGSYKVVLDQTVFYPEGGGQPSDRGILCIPGGDEKAEDSGQVLADGPAISGPGNEKTGDSRQVLADGPAISGPGNEKAGDSGQVLAEVTDVQEEDGDIVHYTTRPVPEGARVREKIDWDRRFDLMQQHSGEHIVSGMIHAVFGYHNVGFHMGEECITIDLSGRMTMDQAGEIEKKVNAYIVGCHPVRELHPDEDELLHMDYRSKKELKGDVRLIHFPGADLCACCGLHVENTGEIGLVKILSCRHFRDGVRIEMLSGRRALDYLNVHCSQNSRIGVALSVKPEKTADAVARLQKEIYELKGALMEEKRKQLARLADSCSGLADVLIVEDLSDPADIRKCADMVLDRIRGTAAVLSGDDERGYQYAVGVREGDVRPLVKELNRSMNGRGGGKPGFAQGVIRASRVDAERFFEEKGFEAVGKGDRI